MCVHAINWISQEKRNVTIWFKLNREWKLLFDTDKTRLNHVCYKVTIAEINLEEFRKFMFNRVIGLEHHQHSWFRYFGIRSQKEKESHTLIFFLRAQKIICFVYVVITLFLFVIVSLSSKHNCYNCVLLFLENDDYLFMVICLVKKNW
jgi:hypothetical protein